ncbi:hypothetical protein Tco_0531261 [Tanacetum coccineum]
MAAVNNIPQLVDKKGGSYAAIAPKLEPEKFNKWKKPDGDDKPESQWTADERRVVVQDQRVKSIIMSCLPDDIMESVISCETTKATWIDLVHSFEGPSDTKENGRENFDDEVDERSREEYLRDLDIEFRERALLESSKHEEEVSDDEEVTQVKVLMALVDDELTVGKNHARNGEWIDITMRKEKKINEKWLTSSKKVSQCISEQIPHQKKKVLGGDLFTESSSKMNENENIFVPAFMGYDQEMVPKTKDWVERLNPDSKLPNFNTGRILVPKSQAINESLKPTKTSNTPESSKDFEAESLIPLPPLENLQGASPSSEDSLNKSVSRTVTVSKTELITPSVPTEVKDTEQESKINELTKLVQITVRSTTDHNEFDHFKRGEKIQATKVREPPKKNHVPKVIALNKPDIPLTEDTEGPSGNNTEASVSINESLFHDVPQSHISNQAFTSSQPAPQDRWSKDQHIKLVNIIGDPSEGMLTRSMAAKLTAASASECLFADFFSKIEPKKVNEALKHPGWVDAMQEEQN